MREPLDDTPFHHSIGQQPAATRRTWPGGGLLQLNASTRASPPHPASGARRICLGLPVQCRFHSLAYPAFANPSDGVERDRKGVCNRRIRPIRTLGIGFEQDLGMADFGGRCLALAHQGRQFLTLFRGQAHNVFFGQGSSRSGSPAGQLAPPPGPHKIEHDRPLAEGDTVYCLFKARAWHYLGAA
ncbi:MAG: hypothetical protein IPL59_18700 [Candidatus Competibacteraceae bacterium]|nr:hypothetical protein [Candidatus Competibacteraceae bacterium]